jgi:hypothetical protein
MRRVRRQVEQLEFAVQILDAVLDHLWRRAEETDSSFLNWRLIR